MWINTYPSNILQGDNMNKNELIANGVVEFDFAGTYDYTKER